MLKKAVQQGRSERRGGGVPLRYVGASERCENEAGGLFQHPDLIPNFEHEIQPETHEDDVSHPGSEHGCQGSSAAEGDGDGMGRPKAEADSKGLPDAHGHTAPSAPAPAQAQRDADQDHDDGDKREGDTAVIVCLQPRGLSALLLPASGVGPNIVEGHQLGIAGQPCGEVVRYQGERDGPAFKAGRRYGSI